MCRGQPAKNVHLIVCHCPLWLEINQWEAVATSQAEDAWTLLRICHAFVSTGDAEIYILCSIDATLDLSTVVLT